MSLCCEILFINGIKTHELSCIERWRDEMRNCKFCGELFQPEAFYQNCCDHSCSVAYNGDSCDCSECVEAWAHVTDQGIDWEKL